MLIPDTARLASLASGKGRASRAAPGGVVGGSGMIANTCRVSSEADGDPSGREEGQGERTARAEAVSAEGRDEERPDERADAGNAQHEVSVAGIPADGAAQLRARHGTPTEQHAHGEAARRRCDTQFF